ncbi:LysE family translocator [Burkholderia oklahomensis]|uniref:LysE type translocator family protein n=2 Tax=Burkholderia oklahomensis TaxID=342113 RepID=A0AAI8FQQ6_9BURK|nr:LysE family translocator [Burkholderia oklahomensis]AIO69931.1 lysE type translocator family protein [Burkholderia oklahomensis]AJX34356.1 lysE type translocator family protein [Burkholderia oklahomensis C6786]AOI38972.1 amino acid transporter [Burkholderia oklahomensis EO147]AOI48673.1 amino acid transporter [Burkholderia oklahomensis C6786]KUY47459.1 amino acid transporter [Burkholderia oklahomensis C6786]
MHVDAHAVFAVFSVYLAGVVIPGPNFVAVAHKAVSATRRDALAMVGGIVLVNLMWASCAILGVGIAFAAFPWLAAAVKLAGAAYLIWFGFRLIRDAGRAGVRGATAPATPRRMGGERVGARRAFAQGLLTNLANPKSVAFYAAVFASAAPAHVGWPTFAAMLAMVATVATSWYGFVALALSHADVATAYRRGRKAIDRFCGGLIVALGVRQLLR